MPIIFTFYVEEVPAADMLSNDTLVLTLSAFVVVDSAFFDINNYSVSVVSGSGPVSIREVFTPKNNITTTDQIIVSVDKPTIGTHYQLHVGDLHGLTGALVGGSGDFIARRTKTQSLVDSLPHHYDTRYASVIRQILTAVGISDDLIGGSRSDSFV